MGLATLSWISLNSKMLVFLNNCLRFLGPSGENTEEAEVIFPIKKKLKQFKYTSFRLVYLVFKIILKIKKKFRLNRNSFSKKGK